MGSTKRQAASTLVAAIEERGVATDTVIQERGVGAARGIAKALAMLKLW